MPGQAGKLARLIQTQHPTSKTFSRYCENNRTEGATIIDRNSHYGEIRIVDDKYLPIAFSDPFSLVVKISLPETFSRAVWPKSRPTPEVIRDPLFQEKLKEVMLSYNRVREFQGSQSLGVFQWWEMLVKLT